MLAVILIVLIFTAIGFFIGLYIGGNLEQKRYLEKYPRLGRLRIQGSAYKLDFGIDPSELRHYDGALLDIRVMREEPVQAAENPQSISDDEMDQRVDELKEAIEHRDALKT